MNIVETQKPKMGECLVRNFSTRQAAEKLDVSIRTMEGWRARGQGPAYMKLSNSRRARVRYSEKALAEFVEKMTVPGAGLDR